MEFNLAFKELKISVTLRQATGSNVAERLRLSSPLWEPKMSQTLASLKIHFTHHRHRKKICGEKNCLDLILERLFL